MDPEPAADELPANAANIPRERMFQTIYFRVAYFYARATAVPIRRLGECIVLLSAISLLALLTYAHFMFTRNPPSCLEHIRPIWPRNGILHVQAGKGMGSFVSLRHGDELDALPVKEANRVCDRTTLRLENPFINPSSLSPLCRLENYSTLSKEDDSNRFYVPYNQESFYRSRLDYVDEEHLELFEPDDGTELELCAVEYAMEYGLLRLSDATRERLKIPIMYVSLDPTKDACFGQDFMRFLTEHLFGYDLIIMSSIKSLANDYAEKGYLRNLVTGEQYRFITMWMSRTSYFTAFLTMIVFTFSISAVLRFSNQQIFLLIVHLFHVFELNGVVTLPVAHLISLILGLVGMEAVMAEFFSDANIAFFVILIVWVADQYDSICCTSLVSRRLWLRFFYLYHFMFYAYYSRFNGQFSYLALLTCWTWTLHSMVYFFHHYELPLIIRHFHIQNFMTNIGAHQHLLAEATHHISLRVHARPLRVTRRSAEGQPPRSAASTVSTNSSTTSAPSLENSGNTNPVTSPPSDTLDEDVAEVLRYVVALVDSP